MSPNSHCSFVKVFHLAGVHPIQKCLPCCFPSLFHCCGALLALMPHQISTTLSMLIKLRFLTMEPATCLASSKRRLLPVLFQGQWNAFVSTKIAENLLAGPRKIRTRLPKMTFSNNSKLSSQAGPHHPHAINASERIKLCTPLPLSYPPAKLVIS